MLIQTRRMMKYWMYRPRGCPLHDGGIHQSGDILITYVPFLDCWCTSFIPFFIIFSLIHRSFWAVLWLPTVTARRKLDKHQTCRRVSYHDKLVWELHFFEHDSYYYKINKWLSCDMYAYTIVMRANKTIKWPSYAWLSNDCQHTSKVLSSDSQLIKWNELFWYPPLPYVSIGILRCQSLQCFHLDSTASQVCQTGTLGVGSWKVDTTHTPSPHSSSTYMHTRENRYTNLVLAALSQCV